MSKYVRTKDNTIIKFCSRQEYERAHPEFIDNDNFNYDKWFDLVTENIQNRILKQADTIEELCDAFVYNDKFFKNVIYEDISSVKTLCSIRKEWTVYGAIWTDKGLLYVAKMNDKGELCLL